MPSDIEIAQKAKLQRISKVALDKLGIADDNLEPYGHYKAKVSLDYLETLKDRPEGKLILVTAISPTPAGEGKTTTTVGLGDALNQIGKKAAICLREPSLGPVFGMKGGAAGGGYAQVVPMEDINLHFTGDFNAIGLANNLLAAMVDNHIHQGNELGFDVRRIAWKRVVDMNDRALREIVVSLGGPGNGFPRQDGFDIVVASEVMAIFCLATSLKDLKERLGNIVAGYARDQRPILARELGAHGAMTVLLKDALKPNLVQTLENNPAFIHGGPFANIAHGCNSVIATRTALKLADYVVTEAGFGADLGAEKFVDIKCRKSGLRPDAVVIVATLRALKYHGGVDPKSLNVENLDALEKGIANLERHVNNVRNHYGLPCVVSINHFTFDTDREVDLLKKRMAHHHAPVVLARHWAQGGKGAEEVARTVVKMIERTPPSFKFVYEDSASLWEKVSAIATKIYGASEVTADSKVRAQIKRLQDEGYGHYPVCVAKTQYSFSTDPQLRGAPSGHVINVREVRLAAGAEFVVMVCGDIMTMPGLPKVPSACKIDLDDDGKVVGLF
ncbi:MAG: formate--tetrahydrofolate ligase [Betaproteobacteria bacterium RIFCSPLOWO2_02_FULL_63_19]|nr:MAG: formate--tetrahydrofolate ligase [Betaproteobacteria bacterium RIFCSPLOWO2_02_FULL_63_19]OGA73237.1 MAG: formate--tetrahydrofolate ligase [Betaproteobacteria bacterium RIFCSPLOWO2_12_FULL_65_14]